MRYRLTVLTLLALSAPAAEPPVWRQVPLPAAARGLIEHDMSGPYVLADSEWYNWDPSVIRAPDGKYHMFHARWSRRIGFSAWLAMGEIVHRVADRPEGPFRFVSVAIPDKSAGRGDWFSAINAKITRFEGCYYLYFVQTRGDLSDREREAVSRAGPEHPRWMEIRNRQRSFVASSKSLDGPWAIRKDPLVEPALTIATIANNPAVERGPDGRYVMIVKGDKPGVGPSVRNQGVATAARPEGPWTMQPKAAIDNLDTEDVSLWYSQAWGRFFAVFHAHTFIGMIESADGLDWHRASQFELNKRVVAFDDGTTWSPDRMERPFVLTDAGGNPLVLYTACKQGDHVADIALPLASQR